MLSRTCSPGLARGPVTGARQDPRLASGTGGSPDAPGPSGQPCRQSQSREKIWQAESLTARRAAAAIVPMPIFDPFREAEKWR